jgi:DtxR family Mn-dependent transcriptional regulator
MLKALSEQGLATYTPYEGVQLTAKGESLALRVLRRHRLIELFLCRVLRMEWDEVHEDAEQMEHVVSDRLVARIDAYLEFPSFDPHGDPIPAANGVMPSPATQPLESVVAGRQFRIARVIDQSPDFLRFLSDSGLELGTEGTVVANGPDTGKMTVQINGCDLTLPHLVADRLMVTSRQVPRKDHPDQATTPSAPL